LHSAVRLQFTIVSNVKEEKYRIHRNFQDQLRFEAETKMLLPLGHWAHGSWRSGTQATVAALCEVFS